VQESKGEIVSAKKAKNEDRCQKESEERGGCQRKIRIPNTKKKQGGGDKIPFFVVAPLRTLENAHNAKRKKEEKTSPEKVWFKDVTKGRLAETRNPNQEGARKEWGGGPFRKILRIENREKLSNRLLKNKGGRRR